MGVVPGSELGADRVLGRGVCSENHPQWAAELGMDGGGDEAKDGEWIFALFWVVD